MDDDADGVETAVGEPPTDDDAAALSPPVPVRSVVRGVLVTAAGLTAGNVTATLLGVRTPVHAVGARVIDLAPASVREWAIDTLGTADKPALQTGVVVVVLLVGVVAAHLALTRRAIGFVVVAAFALAGMLASRTELDGATAWLPALGAGVAAAVALALLTPTPLQQQRRASGQDPWWFDRRAFLERAAAVGAAALVAQGLATLTGRARTKEVAEAAELLDLPRPVEPGPVVGPDASVGRGVGPYLTPNDRFYRVDTALSVPAVDLDDWRLRVDGMVDREVELTFEELLDLGVVERVVTLCCVSNEVGGPLVGNARWLGVPLTRVLDLAGVKPEASQLASESADGWTCGFPTELARDGRDALVAVGMNGDPLPLEHGFPARLVVPGLYGYVSATKWLSRITLTTMEDFDGYWIPRGWAKEAPVKTQSRIDVPRRGASIDAGSQVIAGVAWAQHRGIERVEVRVDDGPWLEAHLGDEVSVDAWRQWWVEWNATKGEHRLQVRATDGDGVTQTERRARTVPDGATGWHELDVEVG